MLSKIKQLLDQGNEEQLEEEHEQGVNLYEQEIHRLHNEKEELLEQLQHLQSHHKSVRMHLEFFYYHPHASSGQTFSVQERDHLPVMCVTIHYMDADKGAPFWMSVMLSGLEDTLAAMKVHYRNVNEPHLYSIFVDTKLYPHQEVKKTMHVLVKQLEQLHKLDDEMVTTRVHVGGDELYKELLAAYEEQTTF